MSKILGDKTVRATLCLPLRKTSSRNYEVLLGYKKGKEGDFMVGKLTPAGGKHLDNGSYMESDADCAVRELYQETELIANKKDLLPVARLNVHWEGHNNGDPVFDLRVLALSKWIGVERETEELKPHWFNIRRIPYGEMRPADRYWLPLLLLARMKFDGVIQLLNDGEKYSRSHLRFWPDQHEFGFVH